MINYSCPDIYYGAPYYAQLIEWLKSDPSIFYDNVRIGSIFGCFPNMIWNGGGVSLGECVSFEYIQDCVQFLYDENIPIKLTLTNPLITKEDLYDRYCNHIVDMVENEKNVVLVNSPIMEDFIREKHPKFKVARSILKSEEDFSIQEELQRYDEVVLPRRYAKDMAILNSIPLEDRHRVEILCNDPCPLDCPRLYTHYRDLAKVQLFEAPMEGLNCTALPTNSLTDAIVRHKYYENEQILPQEVFEIYEKLGFTNLKLAGRSSMTSVLGGTVRYFVKPEYIYDFLIQMFGILR